MFSEHTDIVRKEMLRTLSYIGESAVKMIRQQPMTESWNDITGNLRSSIGYVVVEGGNIITMSNFEQVKDGNKGTKEGLEYTEKIAKQEASVIANNFALIVVAGMEYAIYVERRDNKVVLAKGKLKVEKEAPKFIEATTDRIVKQINEKLNAHK